MQSLTARSALVLATVGLLTVGLSACVSESAGSSNAGGTIEKSELQCGLGNGEAASGDPIKVGAIATASGGVDFSSSPSPPRPTSTA